MWPVPKLAAAGAPVLTALSPVCQLSWGVPEVPWKSLRDQWDHVSSHFCLWEAQVERKPWRCDLGLEHLSRFLAAPGGTLAL